MSVISIYYLNNKYAWRNDYGFEKLRDFEFAKEEVYIDDCLT